MTRTASERLLVISPLLEFLCFNKRRRGATTSIRARDIAKEISKRHGIGCSTVWRWVGQFTSSGGRSAYRALARRTRSDAGVSRFFRSRPEVAESLAQLLRGKRSARQIHESLRHSIPAPVPCYGTIAIYCRRLRAERRAARRRKGGGV